MEAIIHLVGAVLGASVAVYFTIKQGIGEPGLEQHVTLSVAVGALVTAVFMITAQAALERLRESSLINWKARTLGTWLETVSHPSGTRYAISEIKYDRREREFSITGWTYEDNRFKIEEEWISLCLGFSNQNGLYYMYEYRIKQNEQGGGRKGIAYMTFLPGHRKERKFMEGHGYYIDQERDPHPVGYEFRRIDRDFIRQITGKTAINGPESRRQFLLEVANIQRSLQATM